MAWEYCLEPWHQARPVGGRGLSAMWLETEFCLGCISETIRCNKLIPCQVTGLA